MQTIVCVLLLLTVCMSPELNTLVVSDDIYDHPIYTTYGQLRQDVMSRPVAFHRIPPCLDSGFKSRYQLVFSVMIVDVHIIDEINQVMTLQVYFDIKWHHKELAWNTSAYDNISNIWIDSTSIWTPTFLVCMGLDESFVLEVTGILEIDSHGWVTFHKLQYINFACDIIFDRYPFDNQVCKVGFYPLPLPYPKTEISNANFTLSRVYNQSGEWTLTKVESHLKQHVDNGVNIQVPFYTLTVERKSMYYIITIIFPMILTSVMIPLVFLIPVQTGEKISYLVAIFTSTAVFLNFISDVMPRSLSQMPYLAMLLIGVLVEGLLAMLASLIVLNIYVKEWTKHDSDTKVYPSEKSFAAGRDEGLKSRSKPVAKINIPRNDHWAVHSKMLDTVFFFVFIVGQLIFLSSLFIGTRWIQY